MPVRCTGTHILVAHYIHVEHTPWSSNTLQVTFSTFLPSIQFSSYSCYSSHCLRLQIHARHLHRYGLFFESQISFIKINQKAHYTQHVRKRDIWVCLNITCILRKSSSTKHLRLHVYLVLVERTQTIMLAFIQDINIIHFQQIYYYAP